MYQISNEKFGLFVTELRKEKNLTQKDLAEKLYVSDKTVSKWERGLSMPNVVLLIPIADILDVTVTELLRGEKIDTQKNIDTKEVEELVVGSLDMAANSARTVRLFRNRRYIHSDLVVRVFCSKRYVFPLLL